MEPRYELFEHTADIGVRCIAAGVAELVAPAVAGLYAAHGSLHFEPPTTQRRFQFAAAEHAVMLRDLLAELLFLLESETLGAADIRVDEFTESSLAVTVELASVDPARSSFEREVKAVTYHQLSVRPIPGGCEAVYIVDI